MILKVPRGTHVLDDANEADGASLSDVVLAAAEDKCFWHHDVQVEVVGHCTRTGSHLQHQAKHVGVIVCALIQVLVPF